MSKIINKKRKVIKKKKHSEDLTDQQIEPPSKTNC